jgi:hypothetical protein
MRVDVPRQGIHVGRLELGQLAILDEESRDLMAHRGELLQHLEVCGRARLRLLERR